MATREVLVGNPTGLHARPASLFAFTAKQFASKVQVARKGEGQPCNAKSVVMLLALGLSRGETAVITAQGDDEQEAVDALAELVAGFDE